MRLKPESIAQLDGLLYDCFKGILEALGETEASKNHKYLLSLVKGATAVARAANRPPPTDAQRAILERRTEHSLCVGISSYKGKPEKCKQYAKYGPYCDYHMQKRERGYIR